MKLDILYISLVEFNLKTLFVHTQNETPGSGGGISRSEAIQPREGGRTNENRGILEAGRTDKLGPLGSPDL